MKLCIAEKPSVAKDIAKVIGAETQKNGYYEGNGYWVSWTFGHLCTLKEPGDYYKEWKYWDMNKLPMIPKKFGIKLIENSGVKKQFQVLDNLIENCTEVINCGDAGQEGELIQRWVLAKAKSTKPLKRLWISSLTVESIKDGFKSLAQGEKYDLLYHAGAARAIGDWILGMNATRLFTIKYGKKGQVFSIGRVQTPTLAMIVERQLSIDYFVSSDYWELETIYKEVKFNCTLGKINKHSEAEEIYNKIKNEEFEITNYEQKEGTESHPMLFDLTGLQVECNKRFGFSADDTLNKIQKLYESKLVTYPRVDTSYLSEDIYPKVKGILSSLKYYSKLTAPLLNKKIRKSKRVFNDKKVTDHHAIIPTGEVPSGITADEQKVYDTITKRFISVFYSDCKISNTIVEGTVNDIPFRTSGKQILEPGWRVVYGDTDKKDEDDILPIFEKGEKGPHEPVVQSKKTKPPRYFTEASLLRAMETAGKDIEDEELRSALKQNGIGRPSTRSNIIETLCKRNYIQREKKRIVATATGIHLISLIGNDELKSVELTGEWERKLREIESGEYSMQKFKEELIEMVHKICIDVKSKQFVKPPLNCPKCNTGEIIKGRSAWGCSKWKDGCNFTIPFEFKNIRLCDADVDKLIEENRTNYRYPVKEKGGLQKRYFELSKSYKLKVVKD